MKKVAKLKMDVLYYIYYVVLCNSYVAYGVTKLVRKLVFSAGRRTESNNHTKRRQYILR